MCTCTRKDIHTYVHTHTHARAHTRIHTHTNTLTLTHTHTHTQTHSHTHMHTQGKDWAVGEQLLQLLSPLVFTPTAKDYSPAVRVMTPCRPLSLKLTLTLCEPLSALSPKIHLLFVTLCRPLRPETHLYIV
jgi:hypothetical protein